MKQWRSGSEMKKEDIIELENSYFDVQAEIGITKHAGGLDATKELVELCHIDENTLVIG